MLLPTLSQTRVTVVLPTYRRPEFLERAILSVERQTMPAWELVIVDDNDPTSDARRDTEAVVAELAPDRRIRYVTHDRNRGGGAARNTGIRAANAPFVAFLDDDDEWQPTKLERQLECIEAGPDDVALAYCRVRVIEAALGVDRVGRGDGLSHAVEDLLRRNTVGTTSCVLCRLNALHEVGMFDESLPARQDVDLYIRLAQRYAFAFVDEPLVTLYRHGRASISTDIDGSLRANHLFFSKHRTLIESDPEALYALRYDRAKLLLAGRRYREARSLLMEAWRAKPADRDVMVRLAMTYRIPRAFVAPTKRVLTLLRGSRG